MMKNRLVFSPFLISALLLTACGAGSGDSGTGTSTTPTSPGESATLPTTSAARLSGTLGNWPYTGAYLAPELPVNHLWLNASPLLIPATGRLNLPLPVPSAPLATSFIKDCTLSDGFTGANLSFDLGTLTVYSKDSDFLGEIFESNGTDVLFRFYASANGPVQGTAKCDADLLNFNVNFTAGWNLATITQGQDGSFSLRNAASNTVSVPTFKKAQEHLDIQLQDKTPLVVKRGTILEVPVTIYQDGGISGDITLATNINGVDPEPRTITLPGNVGMLSTAARQVKRSAFRKALGASGITALALKTTLKFKVQDYAPSYDAPVLITASKKGLTVGEATLPSLKVLVPQVSADVYPVVAPQQRTTSVAFSVYPQNYRGDVEVSLQGLPANLVAPDQILTFKTGDSQKVMFSLNVSSAVPVGNWPVTLELTQVADDYVTKKPMVLTIMPPSFALVGDVRSMAADANGNLWYINGKGVVRVRQDGTSDAFTDPSYACGKLLLGDDNGIWETSSPLVRFDTQSGSAQLFNDPRGFSGCAGGFAFIDSAGRGWDKYTGVQRLDYANRKVGSVVGSENDQLLDVNGGQVWASTFSDGQRRLVSINADTLERQIIALPGINTVPRAYARLTKVWLPKSVPDRLAVYDMLTGQVSQLDVLIDGQKLTNFDVLGVDGTGRHWLETVRSDGDRVFREWLLYDPSTGTVVKRVPALFPAGSGDFITISPDGILWVRTYNQVTYEYSAYVIRP